MEIQSRDTSLCVIQRGVGAVVAAVVYPYFRMGYDSVEVAEQLRLKSSHVHQCIWKLARLAKMKQSQGFNQDKGCRQQTSSFHATL